MRKIFARVFISAIYLFTLGCLHHRVARTNSPLLDYVAIPPVPSAPGAGDSPVIMVNLQSPGGAPGGEVYLPPTPSVSIPPVPLPEE